MNERLKVALLRSGRTQYAVAAAAGMSETRLSRIVVGRAPGTEEERRAIALALGVPLDELFGPTG
jgi:transcriptional regulator with XRE-family HTH domain